MRTDNWLINGYPWEVRKDDSSVLVRFAAIVVRHEDEWQFLVLARGYR